MNLEEWNAAIFEETAASTGRHGDPLYLYVDEDTLAAASNLDPDAAVADFCAAFNRIGCGAQFRRARELSRHWQHDGRPGVPPYVYALAMTVLAVAMPPIGGAGNVYSRQRQLLGLSDLNAGSPDGYTDFVPSLWRDWNGWLNAEGSRFGTPTAHRGSLEYQGWARSQSFIRSVDKEDVLAYFETVDHHEATVPTDESLLRGLRAWLSRTPSLNRKLLRRLEDPDLHDEFKGFLRSSWASWSRDTGLVRSGPGRRTPARLFWDDETERFDLVLDPYEGARLLAGREAVGLDGVRYQPGATIYLTPESWDIEQWFDQDFDGWEVAPGLTAEWDLEDVYVLERVPYAGFGQVDVIQPGRACIVLFRNAARDRVADANILGTAIASPIPGWDWIRDADLSRTDFEQIVGTRARERRQQSSRLGGGLPLQKGHVFLERGEPDLLIDRPTELRSIRLDSRTVDMKRVGLEQVTAATDTGDRVALDGLYQAVLPLVDMYLNPGDHVVEVDRADGTTAKHMFTTRGPTRGRGFTMDDLGTPAPSAPVGLMTENGGDAQTLRVERDAAFLVTDDGSQAWAIECPSSEPRWLHELGLVELEGRYAYIEVNDLPRPVPGPLLFVARLRSKPNETWQVVRLGDDVGSARALTAKRMEDGIGALSGFVAVHPNDIRSDGREDFKGTRQGLMNQRVRSFPKETGAKRRASVPPARTVDVRRDVTTGRSSDNPYNEFLEWLAERPEGRVGYRRAVDAFGWLWRRRTDAVAPEMREVIRLLEVLGHLQHDRRRQLIRVAPTVVSSIPATGGLRVLAGARPVELLDALDSGEAPDDAAGPRADRFLQNVEVHWFRHALAGLPAAPDSILVRHLAASEDHLADGGDLGLAGRVNTVGQLLDLLPAMDSRITALEPLQLEPTARIHVWTRNTGISEPLGRWRSVRGRPDVPFAFAKIVSHRQSRYAMWARGRGFLEFDWVFGRWWSETRVHRRNDLVQFAPERRQMLLSAEMPQPDVLVRALVASSGIPPRIARIPGQNVRYFAFENVSRVVAERAAIVLGCDSRLGCSTLAELQFEGRGPE